MLSWEIILSLAILCVGIIVKTIYNAQKDKERWSKLKDLDK